MGSSGAMGLGSKEYRREGDSWLATEDGLNCLDLARVSDKFPSKPGKTSRLTYMLWMHSTLSPPLYSHFSHQNFSPFVSSHSAMWPLCNGKLGIGLKLDCMCGCGV